MTATMTRPKAEPTLDDPLADAIEETGTAFSEARSEWRDVMGRQRQAEDASRRLAKELAERESFLKASAARADAILDDRKRHEDYVIANRANAETAVRRTMPAPMAALVSNLEKRRGELSITAETLRTHIELVRQNLREEDALAVRNGGTQSSEPGRTARLQKIANAEARRDEFLREIHDIADQLAAIESAVFAAD